MTDSDACHLIHYLLRDSLIPNETVIKNLLVLTGNHARLLKAVSYWWRDTSEKPAMTKWVEILLVNPNIQYRLEQIWNSMTQEERLVLSKIGKLQIARTSTTKKNPLKLQEAFQNITSSYEKVLDRLAIKGICQQDKEGWYIFSQLFSHYLTIASRGGLGKVWLDKQTDSIYQGQNLIQNLTDLERSVIQFFCLKPYVRHTKTDLIFETWPDDLRKQGVTDDSLYHVIMGLRKKIEPIPSQPCYIVNWRGRPEGGYRFFPEGRPEK